MLTERVVCFGPGSRLVGIETLPVAASARPDLPAIVLLNAGVVHRIGPHRMTVTLARQVAQAGFHAFRYDASGLGDSPPRSGGSRIGATLADALDAMDFLASSSGHQRFIFAGLCSGADNSVRVGLLDRRVAGMILLDPLAYRTPRFYVERLRYRLQDPTRVLRAVFRQVDATVRPWASRWLGRPAAPSEPVKAHARRGRWHPPREVFGWQLRRLTDRGVRILALHTGGASNTHNYAEQFADCFRAFGVEGRVESRYLPSANHTFTEIASQRALCECVLRWLNDNYPRAVPKRLTRSPGERAVPADAREGGVGAGASAVATAPASVVAGTWNAELAHAMALDRAALLKEQTLVVPPQPELIARLREERERAPAQPARVVHAADRLK